MPLLQKKRYHQNHAGLYVPAPGGGADSAAYTNFIARTSGLDGTHLAAYKALLDGMTTDGLFNSDGTTDFFDVFYIFATADQTTALLNICGTSFTGDNNNALTFTADSGFAAVGGSNLLTGFNPTIGSPKYTQNSAHLSTWNLVNTATTSIEIVAGAGGVNFVWAAAMYARVNDNPETGGFAISDTRGHKLGNRSSSTARQLYQNASTTLIGGVTATYGSEPSQAPLNNEFILLSLGDPTLAMGSIGASLNSTQVTNFYNRLRTYMTAVGVP